MYVDLHIHSCLSPCGDEAMTPNNIAGMAHIKGLEVIAVADHNTAANARAICECCEAFGVSFLPAMEITTREEAHLLAYFSSVDSAEEFSNFIYPHLPPIMNVPGIFGEQVIMNTDDEPVGTLDKLLISALDLGIDELVPLIHEAGGLAVPAHINRGSNGVLNALGFLPDLPFDAVEITKSLPCPDMGDRRVLRSSDAHRLEDMAERDFYIHANEVSARAVFEWIAGAGG